MRHRLTVPTALTAILLASLAGSAMAAGGAPSHAAARTAAQKKLSVAPSRPTAKSLATTTLTARTGDRRAPSPASNLAVTAASATSITLSWSASRDNVHLSGYGLYVDGVRVATTTLRTFQFAGLACGRTYRLGVDAYDWRGNRSLIASVLAATTPCLDTTAPSVPGSVHQTSSTQTGVTLGWSSSSDNVGVAGYSVYRGGVPVGDTQQTSLWIGSLVCGAGYSVSVDAYDAAGNHSAQVGAFVTTAGCSDSSPPSTPGQLVVSGTTATSFSVSWPPSSDDRGVAGYRMSVNGSAYATTTSTSMTVGGLSCGSSASLELVAFDAAGNTSPASRATAATAACAPTADTQAPSSPTNLVRSGGTASSVSLTWGASTDNVGVTGYGVYRDGTKIGDSAVTSYTPTGLTCATSYTFAVDAADAAGNHSARGTIVAATSACPTSQPPTAPTGLGSLGRTGTSIVFAWQASSDDVGVSGYRVYRDGVQLGSTTSTSYSAGSLTCGTGYTFGVEAYDADGNRSARPATLLATAACSDGTAPSAPGQIQQAGTTQTSISVSWGVATDNVGVAGYGLYTGNVATGTTAQSSYTFAGLTCGTAYAIGVDAYDAAGNRSARVSLNASTAACATPPPAGTVYVATNGSDANSCTQTQPCLSFGRAYKVAASGSTVRVAAGTYSSQEIDEDSAKLSGAPVVFEPSGGTVTVAGTLDFGQAQYDRRGPKGVTIRNMNVTYLRSWFASSGLLWENIVGKHFDIFDSTNVTVRGGNYGPCQAPRDDASCVSRIDGDNILVENTVIREVTSTDLVNYHVDGMFVRDGTGIIIRNTKFYGNMITNIRIQNCCGGTIRNLVLENNGFGAPLDGDGVSIRGDGIDVDSPIPGLIVRFNSFAEKTGIQSTATQTDAKFTGNLYMNQQCGVGITYSYNVFIPFSPYTGQSPCGSTDKKVTSLGYASNTAGAGFDYRISLATAEGVDYIPTSFGCPGWDFEGTSRPQGGACDAGADER